jgi:hypothetical protein
MKANREIFAVALALFIVTACPTADAANPSFATFALYTLKAGGSDFTIVASRQQIKSSPSWLQSAKEPPLSTKDAARIATDRFREKGFPDGRIDFIHLARFEGFPDKWYYRVTFGGQREYEESPYRTIVLLMNGQVLEPQLGRLFSK